MLVGCKYNHFLIQFIYILMNKSFLLLALCLSFTKETDAQNNALKVGTACVDVSPKVTPFQLRSGKSSYVHDPLHVRAVAFERDGGRAVICLIDAIGIGREMSDIAKSRAAGKTGWKTQDMLICATHTHSAPLGAEWV